MFDLGVRESGPRATPCGQTGDAGDDDGGVAGGGGDSARRSRQYLITRRGTTTTTTTTAPEATAAATTTTTTTTTAATRQNGDPCLFLPPDSFLLFFFFLPLCFLFASLFFLLRHCTRFGFFVSGFSLIFFFLMDFIFAPSRWPAMAFLLFSSLVKAVYRVLPSFS